MSYEESRLSEILLGRLEPLKKRTGFFLNSEIEGVALEERGSRGVALAGQKIKQRLKIVAK